MAKLPRPVRVAWNSAAPRIFVIKRVPFLCEWDTGVRSELKTWFVDGATP